MNTSATTCILYIDDDRDDFDMLSHAIREIDSTHEILEATNGEEGLALLKQLKTSGSLPCLIVLDINMPKLDGRQTFVKIKADAELRNIPIVVFSTSSSEVDKLFFKAKNVEYITKPYEYTHLVEVAKRLLDLCE